MNAEKPVRKAFNIDRDLHMAPGKLSLIEDQKE
jgi:hypothetical protein